MEYAVGIDVGSTQTKAVALDTARAIVARVLIDSGANVVRAGQRAMDEIHQKEQARQQAEGAGQAEEGKEEETAEDEDESEEQTPQAEGANQVEDKDE